MFKIFISNEEIYKIQFQIYLFIGRSCPNLTNSVCFYLGIYSSRSATTNPTVTTKLAAGRKGITRSRLPSSKGGCFCC